jgi:hypothetical protein
MVNQSARSVLTKVNKSIQQHFMENWMIESGGAYIYFSILYEENKFGGVNKGK